MSDEMDMTLDELKNLLRKMQTDALREAELRDDLRECWTKAKEQYKKCYDSLQKLLVINQIAVAALAKQHDCCENKECCPPCKICEALTKIAQLKGGG